MFTMSDRTTANNVLAVFTSLSLTPPKAVAAAYARRDLLDSRAARLNAEPGALEMAVAAALIADRDPATDPDVHRAITAQALASNHGLLESVAGAAMEVIRDACADHLDDIVTAWRPAFDSAAARLNEAHARIGGLALEDTAAIVAKGGDIATVWAEAKTADATIEQIIGGWSSLMGLVRVTPNPQHRVLRLAPLTMEQSQALTVKAGAWDLVRAGQSLSLPTLDEYRARIARIQQQAAADTARESMPGAERRAVQSWATKAAAAVPA